MPLVDNERERRSRREHKPVYKVAGREFGGKQLLHHGLDDQKGD
jgi:hypothetical protein